MENIELKIHKLIPSATGAGNPIPNPPSHAEKSMMVYLYTSGIKSYPHIVVVGTGFTGTANLKYALDHDKWGFQSYPADIPTNISTLSLSKATTEDMLPVDPLGYTASSTTTVITIDRLVKKQLKKTIQVLIESDNDGYIARTPDLPLYGYGDDRVEAINALKSEIESLYEDLMDGSEYTEDWDAIKKYLSAIIKD